MRSKILFSAVFLISAVTGYAQITYYIQGLHRQGNAHDARVYLGVTNFGGYSNSTDLAGVIIGNGLGTNTSNKMPTNFYGPSTALAGVISGNTIGTNTSDKTQTNFYHASTDLAGVISGSGIGTNTSDKTQTNFYNNANTVLLPGVISGSSIGTNFASAFASLPSYVLTNNRTILTTLSNALVAAPTAFSGAGNLTFVGPASSIGVIQAGLDFATASAYISFANALVKFVKDAVPDGDVNGRVLGNSTLRWTDFYLGRNLWQMGANPVTMFSNSATGFYVAITNGVVTASNYVSRYVRWVDAPCNYSYSVTGPNAPALVSVTNNSAIKALGFDNNNIIYAQAQLPHNVAVETDTYTPWTFEPHVHFHTIKDTYPDVTHSNVTWRIEWQFIDINASPGSGVFLEGTNSVTFLVHKNFTHYLAEFGNITVSPAPTISAVFTCRLMRPASALIDYDNGATVLLDGFDLHVPVGTKSILGSASDSSP